MLQKDTTKAFLTFSCRKNRECETSWQFWPPHTPYSIFFLLWVAFQRRAHFSSMFFPRVLSNRKVSKLLIPEALMMRTSNNQSQSFRNVCRWSTCDEIIIMMTGQLFEGQSAFSLWFLSLLDVLEQDGVRSLPSNRWRPFLTSNWWKKNIGSWWCFPSSETDTYQVWWWNSETRFLRSLYRISLCLVLQIRMGIRDSSKGHFRGDVFSQCHWSSRSSHEVLRERPSWIIQHVWWVSLDIYILKSLCNLASQHGLKDISLALCSPLRK